MKVKEFYYENERLSEIKESLFQEVSSIKRTSDKLYCFLVKKHYQAENVVIDYERKIAFLQYCHKGHQVTDERLSIANIRIVELHFSSLKALIGSCLKRKFIKQNTNKNFLLTSKN